MEMAAIVLFCFLFLYFFCQFEDHDPKFKPGKQVFRNQHHQIAFNHLSNHFYHEMPKRRVKVMEMVAILFCCQFEDQDPKITLGKQVFRNQHHQIAFSHLPNLF